MFNNGNTLNRRCCFIINYIKSTTNTSVKNKLLLLYILNVIDVIFTLILLETDMFSEANVVMRGIVTDPIISLILKIGVLGLLVYFVYNRLDQANQMQLKIGNIFVISAVFLYVAIDIMHIIYLIVYLYFSLILKIV